MKSFYLPLFLTTILISAGLQSCCEPATKDSAAEFVDSLYDRTTGYDIDLRKTNSHTQVTKPDSGYYPIYTFAVKNTGTVDDIFTVRVRSALSTVTGLPYGIDISQMVPAGETRLFRTPLAVPDSITSRERFSYSHISDTLPLISYAYLGLFQSTPDSTKLSIEQARISVLYGAIDNGPEGCNTPAKELVEPINRFPDR